MKLGVKLCLTFVLGFLSGGTLGYLFCKKRNESQAFEECTDEEQLAYAVMDELKNKKEEKEEKEQQGRELNAINTQKINYMKFWKDNVGQYDKHSDLPEGEEPVITKEEQTDTEEDDEIVVPEMPGDIKDDELSDIEISSLEEFYHWSSISDGEYDTDSLSWYSGDDVLVDNEDEVIKYPVGYLGFDPQIEFDRRATDDGDPDALYIKNNKFKTIYEIIRYNSSYSVVKRMEEFGGEQWK